MRKAIVQSDDVEYTLEYHYPVGSRVVRLVVQCVGLEIWFVVSVKDLRDDGFLAVMLLLFCTRMRAKRESQVIVL